MPSRTLRARPAPQAEGLSSASHRVAVGATAPVATAQHGHAAVASRAAERAIERSLEGVRVEVPIASDASVVGHLPRAASWQPAAKRVLDLVGAVLGLVLAAPLLALLALIVRLDSPGRAVFVHRRIGRHGVPFRCYKLRTMCVDAEARLRFDPSLRRAYQTNGYKLPVDCDPRVTRFGRFLRATSLDELPQLWNVLRGDMSLVGPRPVIEEELAHYGAARRVVLSVRPGITGAWAVQGRSSVNYPERADIELDYVRTWTVAEDLRILLRTVGVVVQRHGAH